MTDNLPNTANTGVTPPPDIGATAVPSTPVQPVPTVPDVPAVLPTMAPEALPVVPPSPVETIASPTPEIPKTVETVPIPTHAVPQQEAPVVPQQTAAPELTPVATVVDKTNTPAKKGISLETTDSLTASADKEEEDFIEHVDQVHGKT